MNLMGVILEVIPPRILLFNKTGKKKLLNEKIYKSHKMIILKSNRKINEPEQISYLRRIWDCDFWEDIMGD